MLPKTEAHVEINLWEKLLGHHYLVVLKAINQESTKESNSSPAQILLSLAAFHKNLYSSFLTGNSALPVEGVQGSVSPPMFALFHVY